jgi:disulfide bond formation protein DsbB
MRIPLRVVYAAIAVAAFALIATAIFYFQDQLGLDPCPMCILSRYTFVVIGVVALVAAIHGPREPAPKVYAAIIALFALVGIGISVRHSYLQHFPPVTESCGGDLEMLVSTLPLTKALPRIFQGTGSCSQVDWKFLGLSIPEWALVWFALFAVAALWAAFRKPR